MPAIAILMPVTLHVFLEREASVLWTKIDDASTFFDGFWCAPITGMMIGQPCAAS